jgi:hypothetical protein
VHQCFFLARVSFNISVGDCITGAHSWFFVFFSLPAFWGFKKKADVTFQKKADFMGIVIR